MSVEFLDFKAEQSPGGVIHETAGEMETVVWVFTRRRTYLHLPPVPGSDEGLQQLIVTNEDETQLYLHAQPDDIPAIAALVIERARQRDGQGK